MRRADVVKAVPFGGHVGCSTPRMTMHRPLSSSFMLGALAAVAALSLPACATNSSGSGTCSGDFGASAEARRIESFLRAAAEFHAAAIDAEVDLRTTCRDMGVALGMDDAEIFAGASSREGTVGLRAACANVETRIDLELAVIRAAAAVSVTLDVRAPRCDVSVDAYASCVAECEAILDPGSVDVVCEGGELRGTCAAQCTGSCALEVDVACAGTCEGICDGTCSAHDADGQCAGACEGTCHGECVVSSTASCAGECRGSCSVELTEPYCTGDLRAPMASIDCSADCDARVAARVACEPGDVNLAIAGATSADARARADRLVAAFAAGARSALELRARASILASSGSVLVATASSVPSDAVAISAGAFACATAAALDVAAAASSLVVSVDVSVHVSGTIHASAD